MTVRLISNLPDDLPTGTTTVSLSQSVGTPGDELSTITIGSETMTVISGIGSPFLVVDRGADPTAHAVGATVTYAAGAPLEAGAAFLTVQTGAPTTYTTPMVYDDTAVTGGLYGWDGEAYVQVGDLIS